MSELSLELGVKADPIEYRYSYPWLFRIMADEGVRHLQLGTFFEMFALILIIAGLLQFGIG